MDIEDGVDFGRIRLLDADNADAEIAVLETTADGENPAGWKSYSKKIPAAALGKNVRIEFNLQADDFDPQALAGRYLDNVVVTIP